MKLLYITNGINGSGGLERVLSIKASLLAEHFGYQVEVLCLNESQKNLFYQFSSKINMHSIKVGGNPVSYIKAYKNGIQQVVNDLQPDVISVCDDGLKGFFIPLILQTKAKIIYERHVSKLIESRSSDGPINKLLSKIKWEVMERLAKNFHKFVVLTEGNTAEWPSLRNITIIPNPLPYKVKESAALERKVALCVGRIAYQKGQDILVSAWQKVYSKYPDWELHFYGKADPDFLDTSNLPSNIRFFPPVQDVKSVYIDSSIYVMPSRFEGFGMVLIEAMACGLPCISFNCNYGPADIIKNNVDGILVENGDIDDLACQIIKLIEKQNLRKEMGKRAQLNVQRFEPEAIVQKWDNLFRSLFQ